jgi:hypothetical protein
MRMYKIVITSVVGIAAALYGGLWLVMGPLHERAGRQNTLYTAEFTPERFGRIRQGMSRATVISLLGQPFRVTVDTNYPVWALRDAAFRERYGTSNMIHFEVMSFGVKRSNGLAIRALI